MAVAFPTNAAVTGANFGGGSGTDSITVPTGLAAGDTWFITAVNDTDGGATGEITITGFTAVSTSNTGEEGWPRCRSFWKIAGASESAATANRATGSYVAYYNSIRATGAHASAPIGNISKLAGTGTTRSITPTAITIQNANSGAILTFGSEGDTTAAAITKPTAATLFAKRDGASQFPSAAAAYELVNAGTYSPTAWTQAAGDSDTWDGVAWVIEIIPAASGGITADLAKTETADTASASATLALVAALNKTESPDTVAAGSTLALAANLSKTESADTTSAAAAIAIAAALSATEGADSLSTAATAAIAANTAATEQADTISSAASLAIAASLAATETADTISATIGTPTITADLAVVEQADTVSAAGTFAIVADLSKTETADTVAALATLAISADFAKTESADTLVSAATLAVVASLGATEQADVLSATATMGGGAITADLSITEQADSLSAAATLAIKASAALAEQADTLLADANTGAPITANLAITEQGDTLSAAASGLAVPSTPSVSAGGGIIYQRRRRALQFIDEIPIIRRPPITANMRAIERGDSLSATCTMGEHPQRIRNRRTLALLTVSQ